MARSPTEPPDRPKVSLANLKSDLGLCIREHFRNALMTEPRPAYILMATHWNGKRGGEAFRTAAQYLSERSGATVVFTMRTPKSDLESTAERFESLGPRADKVATLLVEDTLG